MEEITKGKAESIELKTLQSSHHNLQQLGSSKNKKKLQIQKQNHIIIINILKASQTLKQTTQLIIKNESKNLVGYTKNWV